MNEELPHPHRVKWCTNYRRQKRVVKSWWWQEHITFLYLRVQSPCSVTIGSWESIDRVWEILQPKDENQG